MKQAILLALLSQINAKKSSEELNLDAGMGDFLTEPILEAVGDIAGPNSHFFNTLV